MFSIHAHLGKTMCKTINKYAKPNFLWFRSVDQKKHRLNFNIRCLSLCVFRSHIRRAIKYWTFWSNLPSMTWQTTKPIPLLFNFEYVLNVKRWQKLIVQCPWKCNESATLFPNFSNGVHFWRNVFRLIEWNIRHDTNKWMKSRCMLYVVWYLFEYAVCKAIKTVTHENQIKTADTAMVNGYGT